MLATSISFVQLIITALVAGYGRKLVLVQTEREKRALLREDIREVAEGIVCNAIQQPKEIDAAIWPLICRGVHPRRIRFQLFLVANELKADPRSELLEESITRKAAHDVSAMLSYKKS